MPKNINGLRRRQSLAINKAYNDLITDLSNIYAKTKLEDGRVFRLDNQSSWKKRRATEAFRRFRKQIIEIIGVSTDEAWKHGNDDLKKALNKKLKEIKNRLTSDEFKRQVEVINGMRSDQVALQFYKNRKIQGATISDRVWDIQNLAKQNIEIALTDALSKGMSAQELARAIKRNLNNPDKLFRRVRDNTGRLGLSRSMRKYHPGRGVYRSAYKNALRLARTEINGAYRESEQVSMLKNNDIVGQRIVVSHSHDTPDLCDELSGNYPATFLWSMWHPNCKCHREFILKTDEEIISEIKGKKKLDRSKSKNYVGDLPDNFKKWVEKNSDKINQMKTRPYFLSKNGL